MQSPSHLPRKKTRLSKSGKIQTTIVEKVILTLLFASLLAPLQFHIYNVLPYSEQISIGSLLLLWFICIASPNRISRSVGIALLTIPPLVIAAAAFWSLIFYTRYEGSFINGALSQRWFLWWLIVPIGHALNQRGISKNLIVKTLIGCFVFVLAIFFFRQFTWDLASLASNTGSQFDRSFIRSGNELRGYRLFFPQYTIYFLLFVAFSGIIYRQKDRPIYLIGFTILVFGYVYIYSRAHIFFSAIALSIFFILFYRRSFKGQIAIALPLLLTSVPILSLTITRVLEYASQDIGSGKVRLRTLQVIIGNLHNNWLTGTGVGSRFSISQQEVFGASFYPSDVGLIGHLHLYGIVGLLIQIGIHLYLLKKSHNAYILNNLGRPSPLIVGSFIYAMFSIISSVTFSHYIQPDSIVVGAVILLAIHFYTPANKT